MKKLLLSSGLLCIICGAQAQNLKKLIAGSNGITRFQTTLTAPQQVNFSEAKLSTDLGLGAGANMLVKEKQTDAVGYTHYRFQQTYAGIAVENAMYIVHTFGNRISGLSGFIVTDFASDMMARNKTVLSSGDAIKAALDYTHAEQYMWQLAAVENELKSSSGDSKKTYYPTVSKVWYNAGEQLDPSALRLAYKVDVYSAKPFARAYYFVDAQTGKVLGKKDRLCTTDAVGSGNTLFCGNRQIHSNQTGTNRFVLRDLSRGGGVITVSGNFLRNYGNDYVNNSANWHLNLPSQNAMDAHWGVEQTYDYYKVTFNRNSYDNKGSQLKSYVNYTLYALLPNASWDGNSMQYGQQQNSAKGVTAIDVTGHELTHGVTGSSSDLNYSGEPGGMNESMSDIFGKCVQFYARPDDINWQIGNEMNWVIRDMSNPKAYQQPTTYGGQYWSANADVHVTSGLGNYFFYLLVNGGSGTNDIGNAFTVSGIGIDKAAAIVYRTNTVYLTPTSKYADWRTACITAATDLYGASSQAVKQVKNAWYAVGVGTAAALASNEEVMEAITSATIAPNPVMGATANISFMLKQEANVVVKVYDRTGNSVAVINGGKRSAGMITQHISVATLKSDTYYVIVEADGVAIAKNNLMVLH